MKNWCLAQFSFARCCDSVVILSLESKWDGTFDREGFESANFSEILEASLSPDVAEEVRRRRGPPGGEMEKNFKIHNCSIWENPQIIHLNRVFPCKPSILGYHYFWKHPYANFKTCFRLSCCFVVARSLRIAGWSRPRSPWRPLPTLRSMYSYSII